MEAQLIVTERKSIQPGCPSCCSKPKSAAANVYVASSRIVIGLSAPAGASETDVTLNVYRIRIQVGYHISIVRAATIRHRNLDGRIIRSIGVLRPGVYLRSGISAKVITWFRVTSAKPDFNVPTNGSSVIVTETGASAGL